MPPSRLTELRLGGRMASAGHIQPAKPIPVDRLQGTASLHIESRIRRRSTRGHWTGAAILPFLLGCGILTAHAQEPDPATTDVATFGAWEVYCSDDAANSLRRCHIEQDEMLVVGIRRADGTGLVAVEVSGDPPMLGSKITYQVDDEPALSWPADGDGEGDSAVLVEQMLHGRRVEARYLSFDGNPLEFRADQAGRTASASLEGFAAAHAEMLKRLAAYRGG